MLAVEFIIKFKEDNERQRKLVSSLRSNREIRSQQDPIEPMKQAEFRDMVEGILLGGTRKHISKISRDEIVNDTDLPRRLRDKIIRTPASNDPGHYLEMNVFLTHWGSPCCGLRSLNGETYPKNPF